uniref:Uncharacterized protein n=1 Tax=Trichuris muris TaxID=70415 RepID=A0A5S6PZ46_TRIMR
MVGNWTQAPCLFLLMSRRFHLTNGILTLGSVGEHHIWQLGNRKKHGCAALHESLCKGEGKSERFGLAGNL